jgi:catechol 2,3-dioxygenase-like lactoylglutathione lyase family enzyme
VVRFAHTNIVARDWRALARFYVEVFGCEPVPPERDLRGDWLDAATGLSMARISGIHLRLPGHGEEGPTLEVFQYEQPAPRAHPAANRPGLGHIAFTVEDVGATRDAVLAAGGGSLGEVVTVEIEGAGTITFAYLTDPEGNIVEVQRWTARG